MIHQNIKHLKLKKNDRLKHNPEKIVAKIISQKFKDKIKPVIIAVGGPGGTGKSTFCRQLSKLLSHSAVLRLDDYKTARILRKGKNLFGPHPEANKMQLIIDHLMMIKKKVSFKKPVYNAVSGDADKTEDYLVDKFNILDGEISTYKDFKDLIDFSIFIDSDWKTQLETRITRDIMVRGYSKDKAIATFLQSNLREFNKYGLESKKWADIHLYSKRDYHLVVESVSQEIYDQHYSFLEREYENIKLAGLIVSVLTPFSKNRQINKKYFIEHLEYLSQAGVKNILVNGGAGEFFSLTKSERRMLFKIARNYFPGQIMLNISFNSLVETREEALWGEEYGADSLLSLPPFYPAGISEGEMINFFNEIKKSVSIPFVLYHHPENCVNKITANIIKETEPYGLKDVSASTSLKKETENYFLADDFKLKLLLKSNVQGFFSGLANCLPELFLSLEQDCKNNHDSFIKNVSNVNTIYKKMDAKREISFYKELLASKSDYPIFTRIPILR